MSPFPSFVAMSPLTDGMGRQGASMNDYGAKASSDLIVTRGDGFRKEKNKKKRGSYKGGEITVRCHFPFAHPFIRCPASFVPSRVWNSVD